MAREYGKAMMSAWVDPEFTSLSRRAQGTYFFLVSQPDLNRAGVLTMALNRWASRSAENDKTLILADLAELAAKRFIVVDESQEEVLVRSYVRHDDGWKSPNIMVAVSAAAKQVTSETLRAVIAEEIARIDTSTLPTKVNERTGRTTREFVESVIADCVEGLSGLRKNPSVLAWGTLPETLPARVPTRFLTTTAPTPETTPETEPETTPAEPTSFDAFYAAYPKHKDKGHARTAWVKAVRKADAETITAAAARYAADPNLPEPQFIPMPATWLNGERWEDGPCPPRSTGRPTDRQGDLLRLEMARAQAADAERDQQRQIGA